MADDRRDGGRAVQRVVRTLKCRSWLVASGATVSLIRFSGTEPLLRIYTETRAPERVDWILAQGSELAGV